MDSLIAFGLNPTQFEVEPFGSGHINKTYLARSRNGGESYVLQQINTHVFRQPEVIAHNHRRTWAYLAQTAPDYLFLQALTTADGKDLWVDGDAVWRLMPYVPHTLTVDKAESPNQAYEAAKQFGRFARLTAHMDVRDMLPTIPDFHNLILRMRQFDVALVGARAERKQRARVEIEAVQANAHIADQYVALVSSRALPTRLMHHDTKINNVLLREKTFEGVCVIDLDTLMPGLILSDLGDMVRTYVCQVEEDEQDVAQVVVRNDYYAALVDGYVSEMRDELTSDEKAVLFYAGQFMVYMQAVRFLSDYLSGDVYYAIKRPEHNLDRARNQITLLQRLNEKEQPLQKIIQECL
jgi:Ser/Thr protein kinase RdoA (MazF antagonist)